MFKNLFKKKETPKEEQIIAPLSGKVKQLEEVPDPTFSEKMMGEGIAIEPDEGLVVAPFDGEIIQVFPTKHAIGIQGESGLEILIHIGLETVSLKGEGFEVFVEQGDKVKTGDRLVTFDLQVIKEKADSTITPIIMTNGDIVESFTDSQATIATAGETKLMQVHLK